MYLYPFFLLILALAPWRPEYHAALNDIRVVMHEYPYCDGYPPGAWTLPDGAIHLCPTPGDYWPWLGLHESQHIMSSRYLPYTNFDLFSKVAMKALEEGNDYSYDQVQAARYYLTYGGHELHAELPWITQGNIPPCLHTWYPWFSLEE